MLKTGQIQLKKSLYFVKWTMKNTTYSLSTGDGRLTMYKSHKIQYFFNKLFIYLSRLKNTGHCIIILNKFPNHADILPFFSEELTSNGQETGFGFRE